MPKGVGLGASIWPRPAHHRVPIGEVSDPYPAAGSPSPRCPTQGGLVVIAHSTASASSLIPTQTKQRVANISPSPATLLNGIFTRLRLWPPSRILWATLLVSVASSEATVLGMRILYHGEVRQDFMVTGLIAALAVSFLVASILTELIRMLAEAERQAQQANQLKSRCLTNRGHEIRCPINAVWIWRSSANATVPNPGLETEPKPLVEALLLALSTAEIASAGV